MKNLTESAIARARALAKSTGKIIKLPDHHRLRLLIRPSGKASWQRFDFNGKEQIATLGSHPAVSIAEARRRREHNRAMIDDGVNPYGRPGYWAREVNCRIQNFTLFHRCRPARSARHSMVSPSTNIMSFDLPRRTGRFALLAGCL
jgi:hypothetical protein